MGIERMSHHGDDIVQTIREAADSVISDGSLPATATSTGIDLLSGVSLPWTDLSALLSGRTDSQEVVYYLTDAAIRTALTVPVWSDAQWEQNLTVLGFPVFNLAHPGVRWEEEAVRGNAISLGYGGRNLDARYPDRVIPLIPAALEACGLVLPKSVWGATRAQHEHMGATAGMLTRMQRGLVTRQLRPAAGLDIITLLGSQRYREELLWQAGGPDRMIGVAVPTREQGWVLNAADTPEFTEAIAMSSSIEKQGVPRGLLITPMEVAEGKNKSDFVR